VSSGIFSFFFLKTFFWKCWFWSYGSVGNVFVFSVSRVTRRRVNIISGRYRFGGTHFGKEWRTNEKSSSFPKLKSFFLPALSNFVTFCDDFSLDFWRISWRNLWHLQEKLLDQRNILQSISRWHYVVSDTPSLRE